MITLKRILFPTDFSENAAEAEHYACSFARQFQAEVHILNVIQDMVLVTPEPGSLFAMPGANLEEVRRSAEQALAKLPDPTWGHDLSVVRATRSGNPFVEIVRYAREQMIDLVILGTHGRTGLAHMLLGSTAERVVQKANCPVLTVRPKTHSFVMP